MYREVFEIATSAYCETLQQLRTTKERHLLSKGDSGLPHEPTSSTLMAPHNAFLHEGNPFICGLQRQLY
jgi:hypothetical protein